MKLESGSANDAASDPFETATGYHRIAIEVMESLLSEHPRTMVVNVPNRGAISDLGDDDVVEVPCAISRAGVVPVMTGRLPESVRGLVLSVKSYEHTSIRAAVEGSRELAQLAMLENPIVGDWDLGKELFGPLMNADERE
jgi:6-phospho-beta-glucosidase